MSAAFRLTTPAGQILTHVLRHPLVLEGIPGRRATRYSRDSLDLSAREVVQVGDGRAEWEATHRFDRLPWALIDILSYAAGGSKLTYYPDTAGPGWDLWLIPTADVVQLLQDPDRFGFGEYSIRLRFRDASTSGASTHYLASPWLWRHRAGSFPRHGTFTRTGPIGAYRDIDGLVKQAAANVLRTTWREVNGVLRAYTLLEAPRTNLFLQSQELGTSWTAQEVTVSSNAGTGGDGTTTADKLVPSTNNQAHYVRQDVVATASGTFCVSVEVEASGYNRCYIVIQDAADATFRAQAVFDLSTGTLVNTAVGGGGGSIVATEIMSLGGGRYFISLSGTVGDAATSIRSRLGVLENAGTNPFTTFAGDGTSGVLFWGAQFEDGARAPSSYIPTTTASASRESERFQDPFPYTIQQLLDMDGATFYADFIEGQVPNWATEGGASPRILHYGSSTGAAVLIYKPSGGDAYRASHRQATSPSTVEVVSSVDLNPTRGNRIQLAARLHPDGSVSLLGRKNAVTDATGPQSAAQTPGTLAAQKIQLNDAGGTGTAGRGIQEYADAIVFPGLLDIDECEELAA